MTDYIKYQHRMYALSNKLDHIFGAIDVARDTGEVDCLPEPEELSEVLNDAYEICTDFQSDDERLAFYDDTTATLKAIEKHLGVIASKI